MDWFVEEAGPDGTFHPAIYHGDKPEAHGPEGSRRRMRSEPRPVPSHLAELSLGNVARFMASDGEFSGYTLPDQVVIAEFLSAPESGVLLIRSGVPSS